MSEKTLDENLLKDLECPACKDFMEPPITLCENGHNICNICKPKVQNCPVCRGKILAVRNITLENIAQHSSYPCKNRDSGCREVVTLNQKINHFAQCIFEKRECPFAKLSGVKCEWFGILSNIKGHVRSSHREKDELIENKRVLKVTVQDICVEKQYMKSVITLNELFYLVWETKFSDFCFAVIYIGPVSDAEKFVYTFKLSNHPEYIAMCAVCKSYLKGKDDILQPGESIVLPYGTILKYVDKNSALACEIEIQRYENVRQDLSSNLIECLDFSESPSNCIAVPSDNL